MRISVVFCSFICLYISFFRSSAMLIQPVVFRNQQGSVSEGISMQGLLGEVLCLGLGGLACLNPDSVSCFRDRKENLETSRM